MKFSIFLLLGLALCAGATNLRAAHPEDDMPDASTDLVETEEGSSAPVIVGDMSMTSGGCPKSMPHRYPGNCRCFQRVWGGHACNHNPSADWLAHQKGDRPCGYTDQGPYDGPKQGNGCPAKMPHRYPGTNRCFTRIWGGGACNVNVAGDPVFHHKCDRQCNYVDTRPAADTSGHGSSGADTATATKCKNNDDCSAAECCYEVAKKVKFLSNKDGCNGYTGGCHCVLAAGASCPKTVTTGH